MKLTFEFNFAKKNGFSEKDFLKVITDNLTSLSREMPSKLLKYSNTQNGYIFEVEFTPVLSQITYQPIFACFSGLDREYGYIENISIPIDKMKCE